MRPTPAKRAAPEPATDASRPTLVVAGRSARLLAEAAVRDGYAVIALDCFGDRDTRRVARQWWPIGDAGGGAPLDAPRTLAALERAAREPGVIGWVAGSDFECEPDLLEQGAARLALIGTAPAAVRRVRDARRFFALLATRGFAHPETRFDAPPAPQGWLRKHARGSGGWHIRCADDAPAADASRGMYYQREVAGTPMSALFIGNGRHARLVGCNELIVRPLGAHPHVFRGAISAGELPAAQHAALLGMLDALAGEFELLGLCSLDFIRTEDGRLCLLEINPRPSASMALYADLPLLRAHVESCREHTLVDLAPMPASTVRGSEIVFARQAFELSAAQAQALAQRDDCHDLPAAGSRFAAGDPVCSVQADGPAAQAVRERLAEKRQALRARWALEA